MKIPYSFFKKEIVIIFSILISSIVFLFILTDNNEKKYSEIFSSLETEAKNMLGKSPYKDKIKIIEFNNSETPYIVIHSSKENKNTINFNNWSISVGDFVYSIDKAVIDYIHGQINKEDTISMWPSDTMIVSFSDSPFGYSFLVNICSGYLDQFQTLSPSLKKECPSIKNLLGSECFDTANNIDACKLPSTADINNENCVREIFDLANYNSCYFANSKTNKEFYKKEWRMFVGNLPENISTISLLDENNLVIDLIKLDI